MRGWAWGQDLYLAFSKENEGSEDEDEEQELYLSFIKVDKSGSMKGQTGNLKDASPSSLGGLIFLDSRCSWCHILWCHYVAGNSWNRTLLWLIAGDCSACDHPQLKFAHSLKSFGVVCSSRISIGSSGVQLVAIALEHLGNGWMAYHPKHWQEYLPTPWCARRSGLTVSFAGGSRTALKVFIIST